MSRDSLHGVLRRFRCARCARRDAVEEGRGQTKAARRGRPADVAPGLRRAAPGFRALAGAQTDAMRWETRLPMQAVGGVMGWGGRRVVSTRRGFSKRVASLS